MHLACLGLIELPPCRCEPPYRLAHAKKPHPVSVDQNSIVGRLSDLKPIKLVQVRRTPLEKLYKGLIEQYHYFGYSRPVGEHLEYEAMARRQPVGLSECFGAPRYIGCRDRYIAFDQRQRQRKLLLLVTNTRFLILLWVKVPHLASHLLGVMARSISWEWKRVYHHEVL